MCQLDIKYGWKIPVDELNQRQIKRVPGKIKWTPKYVFIFMILRRVDLFCSLINKTIQVSNYQSLGNTEKESYTRIQSLTSKNIVMKTPNNVAKIVDVVAKHVSNTSKIWRRFYDVVFSITSSPHLVPFCQTLSHISFGSFKSRKFQVIWKFELHVSKFESTSFTSIIYL